VKTPLQLSPTHAYRDPIPFPSLVLKRNYFYVLKVIFKNFKILNFKLIFLNYFNILISKIFFKK
jgi:hypothetical protein